MKTVFSTMNLEPKKRFSAWQEAICEHYLKVDVNSPDRDNYEGFISKSVVGPAAVSDVFLSPQDIVRNRQHIAHLDKDCFYVTFPSSGSIVVEQNGQRQVSTLGTAVLFDTTLPYRLRCRDFHQAMYVEMPRSMLIDRCPADKLSKVLALNFADGLGWALSTFCGLIAADSESLAPGIATHVVSEIADLLALYIDSESARKPVDEKLSCKFRLQSLKTYIISRLDDPDLTPGIIARENGISLRYLHYLFKVGGTSVSEWIREQRLKRCHQKLTSAKFEGESITAIAFSLGFNSSSHFTRLFKQKFGMTPRFARHIIEQNE
ncbi:MAG: AraC family transcriptional regulator [Deltaproteobacteria bacterium HGW-Deltaproteobacteria-12]|jgi:AraC-like DNA-binding protein|nr:MAG: AraC family transcriptional regulator [Deltaproteobacteria bacterium HGW-Deltaproteobacteria-12]